MEEPIHFPHPLTADKKGLLAMGGDLSPHFLVLAYRWGIFPWYSEGQPILWWSPPERFVIDTGRVHIPRSMRKYLTNRTFYVTLDQHFDFVIDQCQSVPRPGQDGTWITREMKQAYVRMHRIGLAHSIEVWHENRIVGGLYGLGIGKIFSGESMFSLMTDASKFAVIIIDKVLESLRYQLLDCQHYSYHMALLGGYSLDQKTYFADIRKNLFQPLTHQKWSPDLIPDQYRKE